MTTSRERYGEDSSRSKLTGLVDRRRFLQATGVGGVLATAGCTSITGGSGGDSGPIKMGLLAPMPGQFAGGTALKQATELREKQLNDNSGLLGRDVKLIVKDTKLDPATTRKNYRDLVLNENVDATFGLFGSEPALAIIDNIADQKTVHVAAGVASMKFDKLLRNNYGKYKYWFRALPNGNILGKNLANYASEMFDTMGWQDIAIVQEDIEGFKPIMSTMKANLTSSVNVKFENIFSSDTKDFSPILNHGSEANIDGMFSALSQGGIPLEVQWSKKKPNFEMGGGDIFSAMPAQWKNTNGAVEYIWTYLAGATPTAVPTQACQNFIDAFIKEYGSPPPHAQAYTAYDAADAWVRAVKTAGTTDSEKVIPKLEAVKFEGTTGAFSFYGKDSQYPHDPVYGKDHVIPPVIQWQEVNGEGTQVGIWPDKVKSGQYKSPPWVDN